jgi:hypothetical protein
MYFRANDRWGVNKKNIEEDLQYKIPEEWASPPKSVKHREVTGSVNGPLNARRTIRPKNESQKLEESFIKVGEFPSHAYEYQPEWPFAKREDSLYGKSFSNRPSTTPLKVVTNSHRELMV